MSPSTNCITGPYLLCSFKLKSMHRTSLVKIGLVVMSAMLSVVILSASTGMFKEQKNGFIRLFLNKKLHKIHQLSISDEQITSVIGRNETHIYFKTKETNKLFYCTLELTNGNYIMLDLKDLPKDARNFKHEIRKNLLYTYAGNNNSIFITDLNTGKLIEHKKINFHLTRGTNISMNSFAFRAFNKDTKYRDQGFVKLTDSPLSFIQNTPVFMDAGFATDGNLFFDRRNHLLVYSYFYSNRIICMDTNLNLINSIKTIDTFNSFYNTASSVNRTRNTDEFTNQAPSKIINFAHQVIGGVVYVNSMVKADNESKKTFGSNMVIDKYDIKNQSYISSIYVPKIATNSPQSIFTTETILYAKYKNVIVAYSMK